MPIYVTRHLSSSHLTYFGPVKCTYVGFIYFNSCRSRLMKPNSTLLTLAFERPLKRTYRYSLHSREMKEIMSADFLLLWKIQTNH